MYNVSNENFKNIIKSIIELLKDNKFTFEKLKKEDKKSYSYEFDLDKLIEIFSGYLEKEIEQKENKKIIINYYGNPYLTGMLCAESIMNQTESTFVINNIHYGLNSAIIKIVNDALKENNIELKFKVIMNFMIQEVERMNVNKVVCLGDTNSYMIYKNLKNTKVECVPLFGTTLYYDSSQYDKLVEDMKKYAFKNGYELEVFDENEQLDDVIYMINKTENNYCSLLLSKDKEKQEKFTQQVNAKMVCVNENPFAKFKLEVPKELWN